jgi:hypothetical protein
MGSENLDHTEVNNTRPKRKENKTPTKDPDIYA